MSKPKALLVAEKPSVMKDIQKAYEKEKDKIPYDITFSCAAGHLIGLCEPDEYKDEWGSPWTKEVLPMVPDTYKTKVINAPFFKKVKDAWKSDNFDYVINAGDAGREGQLIQALIYNELGVNVPVLRFWASDTTEKTIIKTLCNLKPNEEFKNLEDASYLRLYFDWLFGMNLSRATTLALDRFSSVGRVMSSVLYLIVKREMDIRNFKETPYWEVVAKFKTKNSEFYSGTLINTKATKDFPTEYAFLNEKEAGKMYDFIGDTGTKGVIKEVEKKEVKSSAPTLYNLSDLQKDCNKKFGFSASKTLAIAQSIYEKHHLSYPRTESKCLNTAQKEDIINLLPLLTKYEDVKSFIPTNTDLINKVLSSKKYVNDKKVSDHPAIIPTYEVPDLENLSVDERKVYMLVVKRLVAIFMPDKISEKTTIITEVTQKGYTHTFKTTGTVLKESGYSAIYSKDTKEDTEGEIKAVSVNKGDTVKIDDKRIVDKKTTPPIRYSEATLISAMETAGRTLDDKELEKALNECDGLGTPATRSEIIEKLKKINYITATAKYIAPTEEGIQLIQALKDSPIIKPDVTAFWEKTLKSVEDGKMSYGECYNSITHFISKATDNLLTTLEEIGPFKEELCDCPKCKTRKVLGLNRFYACEGYFEDKVCDFTLPKTLGEAPITKEDVLKLTKGETTNKKNFKWKEGKTSSSRLILTAEYKLGFANDEKKVVGKCPVCGGDVIVGKNSYYCENVTKAKGETCKFSLFNKLAETPIKETQVKEILEKGKTSKETTVKYKSGKSFSGLITYEQTEDGRYRFSVVKDMGVELRECPLCHSGKLLKVGRWYECSNYRDNKKDVCDFCIPNTFFQREISEQELVRLLLGEVITLDKTISKDGKPHYKTRIRLGEREQYKYCYILVKDD